MSEKIDGYISKISVGGKTYALKCEVVEAQLIIQPTLKLSNNNGNNINIKNLYSS